MIKGQNTPLVVVLEHEITASKVHALLFSNLSGTVLKEWTEEETTIDGNKIILPLSETETLKFKPGDAKLEVKLLDKSGIVLLVQIISIKIEDRRDATNLGSSEVLEGADEIPGYVPDVIKGKDGKDGVSPIAVVTPTSEGAVITIQDKQGTTTAAIRNGKDGKDYVLTEADKDKIADEVKELVPPYDDSELRSEITSTKESLSQKVGVEDYASTTKGGVIKTDGYNLTSMGSNGQLIAGITTNDGLNSFSNYAFISKGTLNNVLAERLKEPQFELIESITLNNDAEGSFVRIAEPNGTPYAFKSLFVEIVSSETTSGTINSYIYNTTTATTSARIGYWYSASKTNTSNAKLDMVAIGVGGLVLTFGNRWDGTTNTGAQIGNTTFDSFPSDATIRRLEISRVQPHATVKIYGIRA